MRPRSPPSRWTGCRHSCSKAIAALSISGARWRPRALPRCRCCERRPGPAAGAYRFARLAGRAAAWVCVEPDDGLDPVLNEFNGAVRSIDLVVYELTERQVLAALESAQRRGVQVRVLLEEHPFGAGNINGSAAARLQQAGVQVRWANPRFSLTHEKAAVIDRREALILTLNLTASAFTRNREYGA